jgi:hypothetical protein
MTETISFSLQARVSHTIYPICCTISNFFLVLTFVVYILLPDLHGPLFGKVVLAFIVSLFAAYFTISITTFIGLRLVSML